MNRVEEIQKNTTDRLDWRSEQASNTARRMAISVVALVWGILTLSPESELVVREWQHATFIWSGSVAMLSLFFDWLQCVAGYVTISRDFDRVNRDDYDPSNEHQFEKTWSNRVAVGSFWLKQVMAPLSVALFLITVLPSIT